MFASVPNNSQLTMELISIILFIGICACSTTRATIGGDDSDLQQLFYRIPNPFGGGWSGEVNKVKGYFAIDSFQSSLSSAGETERFEVQEYFSLDEGLTFSLQQSHDNPNKVFAIIGDSNHGKTYIVSKSGDQDEYQCELDNVHHQRHVFPWLFKYTIPEMEAKDSKSKRRRETNREGFIYGIGGIWMNAIHRKIISDLVGTHSPVPGSNVWTMEEGDLQVRMLFDKPEPDADPDKLEALIQESTLNHIRIKRRGIVGHQGQSTRFYGSELKDIYVRGVQRVEDPKRDETLSWLMSFIPQCRARNRKHRVFPSLIQATSISPNRLFSLQYVETKFPLAKDVKSGTYEAHRHRRVFDREYHQEWFSFKRETFSALHQGLEQNDQDEQDVFIKRFTQNKDGHRQAATTYHQVYREGRLQSCLEGEAEHPPHDNLMVRAIHFHQGTDGHRLSGLLQGLGALLMNAVDFHHKQYSLFKKEILLIDDPANPDSRMRVKVNEWQYTDRKSSRTVHFYFRYKNIRRQSHEIADLLRVDIKQAVKLTDDDVIPPTRDDPELDSGDDPEFMIKRFDIIAISTEASADEIDAALKPAEMCRATNGADDGDDDDNDDFNQNDDDFSDLLEKFNRLDLEGFEFVPGKMMNSLEFPDFFEFLDGDPAYTIESSLEIISGDSNEPKFAYLREHVDLETEQTVLSLYLEEELTGVPDVEYYINYNSETIFRVNANTSTCKLAGDVVGENWLRTLSTELKYYRVPAKIHTSDPDRLQQVAVIESSALRSHGVGALWRQAASSQESEFVGLKKEVVLRGDSKFKEVVWSWNPATEGANDADRKQKFEFGFYWNLSQWRQDQEQKLNRRTIELLQLNSIQYDANGEQPNGIRMIRVHPISIETSQSAAWLLPSFCEVALEEAAKATQVLVDEIQIPTISEFMSGASYEAHYTITHSSMSDSPSGSNTLSIVESFDRDQNRAKIITTTDDAQSKQDDRRDIYIDGQSKGIYALFAKENTCKRLARLEGLVKFGATNSIDNREFIAERMYGLGALWTHLAKLKGAVLKITHRYSATGLKQEVRSYQVRTSFASSPTETLEYQVEMRFAASVADWLEQHTEFDVMVKHDPKFVLEMIDLIPKQVRGRRRAELHRSTLEISSFVSLPDIDWTLPEICDSAAPDVEESFPRISEMLQGDEGVFHMRSEITSSIPLVGAGKSLFILDEWFYSGKEKIRLKSSRMAQSLDVLLFVDTEESFDLSVAYQCPTKLPRLLSSAAANEEASNETSKVMKFWRDEETLVDRLAELYFGPVSLWWLAEKNLANVKLASSMDLAPLPVAKSAEPSMMSREREMALESWLVTSPPEVQPAWKFEMRFEKLSRTEADGSIVELHSLESISLTDPVHLGLTTEVEIDIISFKHEEATEETMLDTFMLPEGYGCPRSKWVLDWMRKSSDDVAFTTQSEHRISYEASLELVAPDDNLVVLPTLSGRMLSSGWDAKNKTQDDEDGRRRIDVMAHYCRSRLPDGQTRSSKSVHDRSNNLYFDIDRSTGFCAIDRVNSNYWTLEFTGTLGEFESERITLDRDTFRLLFLDTVEQKFVPINQWNFGGVSTSTYELEVDNLKLSEQLEGPAIVMRRYENLEWHPPAVKYERGRLTRQHDTISVKVLLFADRARGKVKAKLGIRLRKAFNIDLSEMLNSINVAQCYNDGSPTSDKRTSVFVFEYGDIELDSMEWVVFNNELVKDMFTHQLVERARIMPIQFVANPEIDFSRFEPTERNLIIGFTLLDPPTAIEYFEGGPGLDLDERYASVGEVRLVEDIHVCSKWCDRIDCTAMTYCENHLCRVVTDNMVQGEQLLDLIKQGKASAKSDECSFFYFALTKFERPQTMENFASFADFAINEGQNLAEAFALNFDGVQAWPSKFIARSDDFWSFREDTVSLDSGYILVASDKSLDLESIHKLRSGVDATMASTYGASHTQENSYAECLAKCSAADCLLVSYSELLGVCQTVTVCKELWPLLSGALRPEDPSDRYTITVKNYLNEYVRFGQTREPQESMLRLADYSPVECAAACSSLSASSSKCLSFDHCKSASSSASVCYLQSSHIVLDSLDHVILNRESTQPNASAACEHYSRSVAADFKKLANRRYINEGLIERGVDLEKCAMSCHENEFCNAFEYCFDDNHKPSQSCLLINHPKTEDCDNFEDLLFPAASCSVYKLEDLQARQDPTSALQSKPAPISWRHLWNLPNWAAALIVCFVALITGLTTQLALCRLFRTRADDE